jgi:hypothetical protein
MTAQIVAKTMATIRTRLQVWRRRSLGRLCEDLEPVVVPVFERRRTR